MHPTLELVGDVCNKSRNGLIQIALDFLLRNTGARLNLETDLNCTLQIHTEVDNNILKVYQLVLKSKSRKILVLKKLSSQKLVLKVPKKKPSLKLLL